MRVSGRYGSLCGRSPAGSGGARPQVRAAAMANGTAVLVAQGMERGAGDEQARGRQRSNSRGVQGRSGAARGGVTVAVAGADCGSMPPPRAPSATAAAYPPRLLTAPATPQCHLHPRPCHPSAIPSRTTPPSSLRRPDHSPELPPPPRPPFTTSPAARWRSSIEQRLRFQEILLEKRCRFQELLPRAASLFPEAPSCDVFVPSPKSADYILSPEQMPLLRSFTRAVPRLLHRGLLYFLTPTRKLPKRKNKMPRSCSGYGGAHWCSPCERHGSERPGTKRCCQYLVVSSSTSFFSQACKFCHKEEIARMLQNFKYMHDSSCTCQLGCLHDVSCIRSNNTIMRGEIKLRSSKSMQVW
ncbi:uncharacterized protein LOC119299900 [Triticum dicoccoides]|uniref:uncharacterized protein LOC119299900 n=1 Tax=Triticum dicoccoides TaxID=85692 RepID=UPI00188FA375|nr:uncharacterized protein LOC119299900 [Triticum dicoccoides]